MDWYARYPAKYDRKTLHLSLAEHGAYCRLIDYYMMTEQPLPDNDAQIAAILRCPVEQWAAIAPTVKAYFEAREGSLYHGGCDEQLSAQKSIGGRRSVYISRETRFAVWRKTGGACHYCGSLTTFGPNVDPLQFTVDHAFPVVLGGADHIDNLVPACRSCNSSKGARVL